MTVVLWLFGVGLTLELTLYVALLWRVRKVIAVVSMLATSFAAGVLAFLHPNLFVLLLTAMSLLRAGNMVRIVEGRMHAVYLHRAVRRTGMVLTLLQVVTVLSWLAWSAWHITGQATWTVVTGLQCMMAAVLLASTIRRLRRTTWPVHNKHYSDTELPTVTVAIPARNETDDLQACLVGLVHSNYPKLEIVVLDDCSQTRRTPEIIRDFAHDGVRFVQGEPPDDTWLPKNQAYDRLLQEASGDYVLFCGVDIRFGANTVRDIIGLLLAKHKHMMSILPQRNAAAQKQPALAQAMRYLWELAPPRRWFNRPPILSSCWIIDRQRLQDSGGFRAVARSIVPEAHVARELTKQDGYSFMRANINLQLTSVKTAAEQRATAVRTRYPQLHRRPENVLLVALWEVTFLLFPFVLAAGGYWLGIGLPAVLLAAAAAVMLTIAYELIAVQTRVSRPLLSLVLLPLVVSYDLGMLMVSMWQYEFSVVEWKGRNICVPAMHVIPHLPKV